MNKLLTKTFIWMMIGLFITFFTGYLVSFNELMIANIFKDINYVIFVIIDLVLVLILSTRINKMKPATAKIMFMIYAFLNGLTFTSVFIYYNITSILSIFLVTSILFGILSFIGYKTKHDLTKVGPYLFAGLIGIILVSFLNIFFHSSMIELIVSIIAVLVFIGITAFDVNKITLLSNSYEENDNISIICALDLYLDFINIFLYLIQLFGDSDN